MSTKIESQGLRDPAVPGPSAACAWDPYDVWLNRVKKPRDEQSHTVPATIKVTTPDISETARLRALRPSLLR